MSYARVIVNGKRKRLHIAIVEQVLGRELVGTEMVHHFDGDKSNDTNSNLVVCPDQEYHKLLHVRTEAYEACGDANKRRCYLCRMWDSTIRMSGVYYHNRPGKFYYHKECARQNYHANSAVINDNKRARKS